MMERRLGKEAGGGGGVQGRKYKGSFKVTSQREEQVLMISKNTMEYYSAIKKSEIMPFAAIMPIAERDYHTK